MRTQNIMIFEYVLLKYRMDWPVATLFGIDKEY